MLRYRQLNSSTGRAGSSSLTRTQRRGSSLGISSDESRPQFHQLTASPADIDTGPKCECKRHDPLRTTLRDHPHCPRHTPLRPCHDAQHTHRSNVELLPEEFYLDLSTRAKCHIGSPDQSITFFLFRQFDSKKFFNFQNCNFSVFFQLRYRIVTASSWRVRLSFINHICGPQIREQVLKSYWWGNKSESQRRERGSTCPNPDRGKGI